jgi:hypothetical protein
MEAAGIEPAQGSNRGRALTPSYRIRSSFAVPIMRIAKWSIVGLWRRMSYHIETSRGSALPTVFGAKHVQTFTAR